MSQGQPPIKMQGPPYPPRGAGLGGMPTFSVDAPISAVFMALFIASAVFNMTIFQINRKRGHKFIISAVTFGFSMARILANVMRIVWARYPRDASIAIAANVLTNAGVVLLFIINLILAQRIVRAYHPNFGWSTPGRLIFRFFLFSVIALLIMIIIAVVYSFYTLDMSALHKIRNVQLFAITYLAILAFLPVPILALALLTARHGVRDNFGTGSMRYKVFLVLFAAVLLTLGAGFRAGVAFEPRPANNPAWFHSKACYYIFNYTVEIIVVAVWALSRFDRRFWVPNGSKSPGEYSRGSLDHPSKIDEESIGVNDRPVTAAEQHQQEKRSESQLQQEQDQFEKSTSAS